MVFGSRLPAEKLKGLLQGYTGIENVNLMSTVALADATREVNTESGMMGGSQIAIQREILSMAVSRRNRMKNNVVDFLPSSASRA